MTVLIAYDLGPVYFCSPVSCWFGASCYTSVTSKHSQVLNSPSLHLHLASSLCTCCLSSAPLVWKSLALLQNLVGNTSSQKCSPGPITIALAAHSHDWSGLGALFSGCLVRSLLTSFRALSKPCGDFVYWSVMLTRLSFFWGQGVLYISVYIPSDSKSTWHLEGAQLMFLGKKWIN